MSFDLPHEEPFDQESYEEWANLQCTCKDGKPDWKNESCPKHGKPLNLGGGE